MVKIVCDSCGKQMTRWLRVRTSPQAQEDWQDVGDLLKYENSKDLCEECYKQLMTWTGWADRSSLWE